MGEAGGNTIARGALLRALLREGGVGSSEDGRRDGLLARIAKLRSDPGSPAHRLFSIAQEPANDTAEAATTVDSPAARRLRAQDLVDPKGGVFDFPRTSAARQSKLRSIIDGARRFWLGALTRDQIADVYGDEMPQVREYDRLTRSMENERSKRAQDAEELYNAWAKLGPVVNERLAGIMADAALYQVHPDAEFELPEGVLRGSREDALYRSENAERWGVHRRLKAEYDALPNDAKAIYQKVKRFHAETLQALRDAVEARIEREVEDGPARAAALDNREMMAVTLARLSRARPQRSSRPSGPRPCRSSDRACNRRRPCVPSPLRSARAKPRGRRQSRWP